MGKPDYRTAVAEQPLPMPGDPAWPAAALAVLVATLADEMTARAG